MLRKSRASSFSFFSKMKKVESDGVLAEICEVFLSRIPCKVVRTTLRWAFKFNTLHTFPDYHPELALRVGIDGLRWYRRVLALRSKSDDVRLGIDVDAAAWEKYCESELRCAETNRRIRKARRSEGFSPAVAQVYHLARRKISDMLGDAPGLSDLHMRFGPGASVSCRKKTTARHKLSAPVGCSIEGIKRFDELAQLYPAWLGGATPVLESASVSMVPKNAKTSRSIEVQPLLNVFVQLGIGSYMKRCLVKHGVNLFDQERNRSLARVASLSGSNMATVDFSSASDSISVELVWELLPPDWFDLLSDWRCASVTYGDLRFHCDKFSAMGNGYTFELESLIFYALAHACCKVSGVSTSDLSIFGDDLICPSAIRSVFEEVCEFSGLVVNHSKTFWSGPFRESCGADYFLGVNVRPTYVTSRLTPARLVKLHNDLVRQGESDVARVVADHIPPRLRLYGPDGFGDGHLLGDFERKAHRWEDGWNGFLFRTFTKKALSDKAHVPGDDLLPAYHAYQRGGSGIGFLTLNDRTYAYRLRDSAYCDLRLTQDADPYVLRGGERCKLSRVYAIGTL